MFIETFFQANRQLAGNFLQFLTPKDEKTLTIACKALNRCFSVKLPYSIIAYYKLEYRTTKTIEKATRCYLLQFQHYNAEFTTHENYRLKFPSPLFAPQEKSSYVRTGYPSPLFQLAEPWIKEHLTEFFQSHNPCHFIKLTTNAAKTTLKLLCKKNANDIFIEMKPDNYAEIERESVTNSDQKIIFIELKLNDLNTIVEKLADIMKDKRNKQDRLIFLLQEPGIDCIFMWGAKWHGNDVRLDFKKLDRQEMFGKEVFSLLNKAGAVPDRLALNDFLATQGYPEIENWQMPYNNNWEEAVENMTENPIKDRGADLYRRAILRWHQCLEYYGLASFAEPLLSSQVSPWIFREKGGIEVIEWAKAYQNMCEIVFFCIQSFPEKFSELDLKSILLESLQGEMPFLDSVHTSFCLFPYGMSPFLHIFNHLLMRFDNEKITISCPCQSFFETLDLIQKIQEKNAGNVIVEKQESLEDLEEDPDILIVDIHPNNASKKSLHPNNVEGWVKNYLKKSDKKLILILDVTLNHFSDPIIQKTFREFSELIKEGRLEIFAIQSLAKLIQLGADNFSGGACLYFGNRELDLHFPKPQSEKIWFFSLLHQYFQPLIKEYVDLVRNNTRWMYSSLSKVFKDTSVATIIFNGDSDSVYVAIDFQPLLEKIDWTKLKSKNSIPELKEKFVTDLRNILIELSESCGLPLTSRQSLGFSLSNMSHVVDSIRFSLGVENKELMQEYTSLIETFHVALSNYADGFLDLDPKQFLEGFKKRLNSLKEILKAGNYEKPLFEKVPIPEKKHDQLGNETWENTSFATLQFDNHKLVLTIEENQNRTQIPTFFIRMNYFAKALKSNSRVNLMKIFLHFVFLKKQPTSVSINTFNDSSELILDGIEEIDFSFLNEEDTGLAKQFQDEDRRITLHFKDDISCTMGNQKVSINSILVTFPELNSGSLPISIGQFQAKQYDDLYKKCYYNNFKVTNNEDCYLIEFTSKKDSLNYLEQLNDMPAFIKLLNTNNQQEFPIPSDPSVEPLTNPLNYLTDILINLGYLLADHPPIYKQILKQLKSQACKQWILLGSFKCLVDKSIHSIPLKDEQAKYFATQLTPDRFHYELFKTWLRRINTMIDTINIEFLPTYLVAFSPLISGIKLSDLDFSLCLHRIAQKSGYKQLNIHLKKLELELIEEKVIRDPSQIDSLLEVTCFYPLEEKTKGKILENLSQLENKEELLERWLCQSEFHLPASDQSEFRSVLDEEALHLTEEEKCAIKEFINAIGAKDLLLKNLEKGSMFEASQRWARLTNDELLIEYFVDFLPNLTSEAPKINTPLQINSFLKKICFYPFEEAKKLQILEALPQWTNEESLKSWISEPNFCFSALDQNDQILRLGETERPLLQKLFTQIGAKQLLLENLKKGSMLNEGMRWLIITNDPDLKKEITESLGNELISEVPPIDCPSQLNTLFEIICSPSFKVEVRDQIIENLPGLKEHVLKSWITDAVFNFSKQFISQVEANGENILSNFFVQIGAKVLLIKNLEEGAMLEEAKFWVRMTNDEHLIKCIEGFLQNLENELIEEAKAINAPYQFNALLERIYSSPLEDTKKFEILTEVPKLTDEKILENWIKSPHLDFLRHRKNFRGYRKKMAPLLSAFFTQIGAKDFLIRNLKEGAMLKEGKFWVTMTNEESLKEYTQKALANLENSLILEVQAIKNTSHFNPFLKHLCSSPLNQETKLKILENLPEFEDELLKAWIIKPNISLSSQIDDNEVLTLSKEDSPVLSVFFTKVGAKELLLANLIEGSMLEEGEHWASVINDDFLAKWIRYLKGEAEK